MIYGTSILTSVVADWTITGGTMLPESISLEAGGTATCSIDLIKLPSMPDMVMLSVTASDYSKPYEGGIYAILQAEMANGMVYTYNVSLVDTGDGTCILEIPVTAIQHTSLTVTLKSAVPVIFTDWALFAPKLSDVDLTEVLDKLPRLLKDYNMSTIDVGPEEDIIAMISAYVTETTELTGQLEISYYASQDSAMVIRIKDNEVSELYAPITVNVLSGWGSVGIPHAYLTRLRGYHNFTVTAQVISGAVRIDTRKIMYAIDGGRLAYSVLDVGSAVYDLSLRKLASEYDYSFIYAICIDNGKCLVKKSEHTEVPGAAWVSVAQIGDAIDAAIEFDGTWVLTKTPQEFNTDEYPWVAWVSPTNALNVKRLDDDTTLRELSTSVLKVSSIKGWDNLYTPGSDQGLLIGYIKSDGKAYYRGRCRQADESYLWEPERQLTQFVGTATDINLFRTNDFRIGFNVLASDGTTSTYLTTRNWAGMSVAAEKLSGSLVDPVIVLTPITYMDAFAGTENISGGLTDAIIELAPADYVESNVKILTAKRIDNNHVKLTFNYDLINVVGQEALFTIQSSNIVATAVGDNAKEVVLTTSSVLVSVGVWTVTYTAANSGIRVRIASYSTPRLENRSVLVSGDPPNHIENIQGGLLNPVVNVTKVYYSDVKYDTEKISGSLVNPVIVLTKVGSSPL